MSGAGTIFLPLLCQGNNIEKFVKSLMCTNTSITYVTFETDSVQTMWILNKIFYASTNQKP